MIQRGQQAILTCNGLFTSDRTLRQVFAQELAYLREPVGTARRGAYTVAWEVVGQMVQFDGGRERVVRLPTFDAEYYRGGPIGRAVGS